MSRANAKNQIGKAIQQITENELKEEIKNDAVKTRGRKKVAKIDNTESEPIVIETQEQPQEEVCETKKKRIRTSVEFRCTDCGKIFLFTEEIPQKINNKNYCKKCAEQELRVKDYRKQINDFIHDTLGGEDVPSLYELYNTRINFLLKKTDLNDKPIYKLSGIVLTLQYAKDIGVLKKAMSDYEFSVLIMKYYDKAKKNYELMIQHQDKTIEQLREEFYKPAKEIHINVNSLWEINKEYEEKEKIKYTENI